MGAQPPQRRGRRRSRRTEKNRVRRRPGRRERPSEPASPKIRDALQAEEGEGEGQNGGPAPASPHSPPRPSAGWPRRKTLPGPGDCRARGLRRQTRFPTRAPEAPAGEAGTGGCSHCSGLCNSRRRDRRRISALCSTQRRTGSGPSSPHTCRGLELRVARQAGRQAPTAHGRQSTSSVQAGEGQWAMRGRSVQPRKGALHRGSSGCA